MAAPDPVIDDRATYTHTGGTVEHSNLQAELAARVDGTVRFDEYTRQLYATDASAYEVKPIGIVRPKSTEDVASVIAYCNDNDIAVLPRGAGTSLAGQAVNEAVVLDFTRYMNSVQSVDQDAATATAEAGTVLADLNAAADEYELTFGPDPAAGDRSVLGGAIGNNSTGAHSLVYGKTDHYVESAEVVLADGTVHTFGEMSVDELRAKADPNDSAWGPDGPPSPLLPGIYAEVVRILDEEADEIDDRYPDLKRNVSGYNLDRLLLESRGERPTADGTGIASDQEPGTVNLARLLAGSEGTLAIVTEATVSLEPVPETKAVALLTYRDVYDAVSDVAPVLEHGPAAVELIDDELIDLALETEEFHDVAASLPDDTRGALLVEFYADSEDEARQQIDTLLADRMAADGDVTDTDASTETEPVPPFDAIEAYDADDRANLWKMRKAAAPILLSRTSDEKHISFIEDCAVPAEHLPEYVDKFRDIIDDHDANTSFYAHAGPGVLHVRPLVDTKTADGLDSFETIADEITDYVTEIGGSVSGEHGDGRARTQWNKKFYGDQLWDAFRELKTTFDPNWILNPGQVCGTEDGPTDMTEDLRFDPEYDFEVPFEPQLNWDNENGFQGMTELCHGCAGCTGFQDTTGGVMCPTYRAAEEEITSTRGRANMLRSAMNGELPDEIVSEEFVTEVLDLCISCKGCKKDCPSGVDMAKLKAEVVHEYHQRHGSSLRDKLFANVDSLATVASSFAPLANAATKVPGVRSLMEETVGIAKERSLPKFTRSTLQKWWRSRGGAHVPEARADRKAILFADTYTNYSRVDVGKAAIRVLEAANVHVQLADRTDSGRPAYSKSFIDKAKATAKDNVRALTPQVRQGWDVVFVEPSDAVMAQSDYLDLLEGSDVTTFAKNSYGVSEYLDVHDLVQNVDWQAPEKVLTYHGHCHQKGTSKDHHAANVLEAAGYEVDELDSGCCGMAGSFGYEAEHHSMSKSVGNIVFDQVEDSHGDELTAPGASCRTQFEDSDVADGQPPHPAEELEAALPE